MFRPLLALLLLAGVASAARAQPLAHIRIDVSSTNTIWTPTGISVEPGDMVFVRAEGMVRLGPYHPDVSADGAPDIDYAGALEIKVGIHPGQRIGSFGCILVDQSGQLRLRIRDFRYDDNSGGYVVNVIHIPGAAIPEATIVQVDGG